MTDYQTISGRRIACQATLIGLFYAAAQYKKVPVPGKALSAGAIAAILQGFSTRARTPLGGRSSENWIFDVITLALVAYATSSLKVANKTKYVAGALLFGSQLVISNFKPQSISAHIDAIETNEDCGRVWAVLKKFSKDTDVEVSPQELIKACEVFVLKAEPLIGYDSKNSVDKALDLIDIQNRKLEGFEKLKACLNYVEFLEEIGVGYYPYFGTLDALPSDDATQKGYLENWNQRIGTFIRMKWEMLTMDKDTNHQEMLNKLSQFIKDNSDHLTKEQRLNLYLNFIEFTNKFYGGAAFSGSPPDQCVGIAEEYIKTFEKLEKAEELIDLAEFLRDLGITHPKLINEIIPAARDELDEAGKAIVDQWLDEGKGKQIKEDWN